jgi:adenylosuccinate lyase
MLPGNPRYQPKILKDAFAYESIYKEALRVELAVLETLGDIGVIPKKDAKLLTPSVKKKVLSITTAQIDKLEREVTKHDVRAMVHLIQARTPKPLRPWVHIPLTSCDVLSTAQALQFKKAHVLLKPEVYRLIGTLADLAERHAKTLQVGRTHGQHALPVTVGFWLATVLARVLENARNMDSAAENLRGKISGAVGAYNAQHALFILKKSGKKTFEERALAKLGLNPAPISTQITPPEPVADYLFATVKMSATLAQFGRDCRHLMRSEIGEVAEEYGKGQVGSSTMAHKRNPISFENLEGMWLKTKNEFGKVLDVLISEHQRDLVNSSVMRDFPIISVNLAQQLSTLLRESNGKTFIERITFDTKALNRNFNASASKMMAEPLYIALQMAGYDGDAHDLINHKALAIAEKEDLSLVEAVRRIAGNNKKIAHALKNIPAHTLNIIKDPSKYTGLAEQKTKQVVKDARAYVRKNKKR